MAHSTIPVSTDAFVIRVDHLDQRSHAKTLWWARIALAIVVVCIRGSVAIADEASRPNILVILADDLGYGDVGCYNPESNIPTPNIDALARRGMRMTDAHSPCTVCTPTRYSLMTGQMAFRVPNGGRVFSGAGGPSLIASDRLTLPGMLQQNGYATACFGKWHIGLTFYDEQGEPIHRGGLPDVQRIDYSRRIDGGPIDCGFDQFFGTACCPTTDWLYAFIDGDRIPTPPTGLLDRSTLPNHPYANDNRRGMQAPDFDLETVDLVFLEKSRQFLHDHVRRHPDQPFFLLHSTQAVHLPSFPAPAFQGQTDSGPHGDFIAQLDHIVGELTDTLDELGIAENTLVIFTSDNGPEVPTVFHMRNDHQHDGARPWRGVKRDNWEGGHRVPFIATWPGSLRPGTTSDALISLCDVFATAAETLDVDLPDDAAEDSYSLIPVFQERLSGPLRPYLLQQGFGGTRWLAIRQGKWKYLDHKGSGGNNYEKHRQLKLYALPDHAPDTPGQLYDFEADPGETFNLVEQHPDVAARLRDQLHESVQSGRSRPAKTANSSAQ
ncbi:sulfatase family protein [Crateriforma conspicua]|uniref:Arylsulfatase n=1 Tax=Crateriforma conspicua TaxID=2527996 RepID=A0A5C5Y976_9PLAN|nr:arylsulfatase [Crateriforma conspicua]TWT71373.1 Arylsulfatase precursor [Crateriforma conspicua]